MKQALKGALAAAALPFAAVPLALASSVAPAGTAALIPDGPATVLTHGPAPWDMPNYLQGAACGHPKACEEVLYWWIISTTMYEIGVNENLVNLDYAINNTDGPKIVYAFSGGARIATAWLTEKAEDSDVPAEDLSFLLIGNGTRKYGGASTWHLGDGMTAPPTRYHVIDVAREYDPVADFPTNPFNLLAVANALSAFNIIHMSYGDVDLQDPDNYVWSEDNTTYVFVPTKNLPLLQPLRTLGLDALADQWEEPLRAIIDSAYSRPYLPAQPQGTEGSEELRNLAGQTTRTAITSEVSDTEEAGVADADVDGSADDSAHDNAAGEAAGDAEDETPGEGAGDETPDSGEDEATPEVTEEEPDTTETDETQTDETQTNETQTDGTQTDGTESAGTESADEAANAAEPTGPKHRAPLNGTRTTKSAADGKNGDNTGDGDDRGDSGDAGDSDS